MTYPLDFPSTLKLNGMTLGLQFTNSVTRSPYTMERQAFEWDGQMWMFSYTVPACSNVVADEWIAFADLLHGQFGTFLLGNAARPLPKGIGGGSPLVNGAGQAGYALNVKNAPHSVTQWLKKGDHFQYGTGATARLHRMTADANTDSSGNVTLQFVPKLRYSPADSSAIVINNPVGNFTLSSNTVTHSVDTDGYYHLSFDAQEAL